VLAPSFTSAFVPTYIRVYEQQGAAAAQRLVSGVLVGGFVIFVAIALAVAAAAPLVLPWLGWGFDGPKLALARSLCYMVSGMVVVCGISAIFAAVLNAHEHFGISAAAPMALPVATVVVFWLFQDRFGISALAAGTMLGFALECCILGIGMRRFGLLRWPRWSGFHASLAHVSRQYAPVAVGSLLMSSSIVVDQSMAASLGSGNVSILNYGNKVVAFVLSIVAISLSTVLFPRFSRMISAGQWDDLDRMIRGYSKLILLASIPLVALLAVFSQPMIGLLFERGAFTPQTTIAVSWVQIYLALQIPFYVLGMLGARLLSALDGNQIMLRIGALNLAMNIGGNYVFMHFFGVSGIAMSTSLMYVVAMLATYVAIRLKMADAAAPARTT
jgi:putative peptidoglycan lipid II flippase